MRNISKLRLWIIKKSSASKQEFLRNHIHYAFKPKGNTHKEHASHNPWVINHHFNFNWFSLYPQFRDFEVLNVMQNMSNLLRMILTYDDRTACHHHHHVQSHSQQCNSHKNFIFYNMERYEHSTDLTIFVEDAKAFCSCQVSVSFQRTNDSIRWATSLVYFGNRKAPAKLG